jgi:tRNA (cytidine32/uridine32-2'-O)-methyltransferase
VSEPVDLKRLSKFERSGDPVARREETLAFESDWLPPEWFNQVSIVLVQPENAVNIGAAVRALGNTGFAKLRLVDPAPYEAWDVIGVAHYTHHIVDQIEVYPTIEAAVADCGLVIGLIGKHQAAERNALPFADALSRTRTLAQGGARVALVYGRERTGLTNTDLDFCQAVTTIPSNPAYPSFNLAQAVLLTLHPLFLEEHGAELTMRPPKKKADPATSEQLLDLFADLERMLEQIEFFKNRSPVAIMRSLRAMFYRGSLDSREAMLMRGIMLEVRRFLVRRGIGTDIGPIGRNGHRESSGQ